MNSLQDISPYSKDSINEYLNCQNIYYTYKEALILNSLHQNMKTEK